MFKTFQQEIEMFEKAQVDSRIYGIFLSNYFDLVLRMAMKFSSQDDTDDLFQEGCIGLMKAFDRFDPNKGYRFKTRTERDEIEEIKSDLAEIKGMLKEFVRDKGC